MQIMISMIIISRGTHINYSTIKLIAPINEDTPAKWRLKIAKSTEGPECASIEDNGGYTVQPVPAPTSTNADSTRENNAGGNNQNDILFSLGNAISGAPITKEQTSYQNHRLTRALQGRRS